MGDAVRSISDRRTKFSCPSDPVEIVEIVETRSLSSRTDCAQTTISRRLGDAELVRAVASGDAGALTVIHDRYAERLRAALRKRIASPALIDEVVQDTFVELWRHPDRWDPQRGRLPTLLVVMARGRAIDVLRSEDSRRTREARCDKGEAADVESTVIAGVVADQVRCALESLPDSQSSAIILAFFGQRSYREVASELGRPEGTVKSQIRAGLRRLEPLLWRQPEPAAASSAR